MAEGARLESVYTATYRGFESPPHRHILRRARTQVRAFFFACGTHRGMRTPDRGSTTGNASWTDREPASGLPARGERSESIPPHRHILRRARTQVRAFFFSHAAPAGGMRTPDRGSTTGAASWTDRARSKRAAPQGRAKRVNPPSPPYFKKSSYASTGFFFACGTRRGG